MAACTTAGWRTLRAPHPATIHVAAIVVYSHFKDYINHVSNIDSVLIDQQSVGKRSLHLIDTLLPPTLIPLSGVGTTCFSSCCDKDSAIIFTTGRLPDVNPP
jgi:hypothetical protein